MFIYLYIVFVEYFYRTVRVCFFLTCSLLFIYLLKTSIHHQLLEKLHQHETTVAHKGRKSLFFYGKSLFFSGKCQLFGGKCQFFMGKCLFFVGKCQFFSGKCLFFVGKCQFFMGKCLFFCGKIFIFFGKIFIFFGKMLVFFGKIYKALNYIFQFFFPFSCKLVRIFKETKGPGERG